MVGQISGISFPPPRVNSSNSARVNQPTATPPQPSTRVTLSSASDDINAIYTLSAQKLRTPTIAGHSQIDMLMGANLNQPVSGSFQGLGKALLLQLKDSQSDFSAAVTSPKRTDVSSGDDQASAVALDIVTQSGVKVSVSLSRQQGGLVAQVKTTGGELTESETVAISGLADAFQTALDGLSAKSPAVNIDGLTGFDSKVLKSVDLNTDVRQGNTSIQSLNYQSDATQRALSYKDSTVSFQLNTDLTHPELLGTQGQQNQALAAYDKQLAAASNRGQGDNALISMFKSAFHALNSHYGSNEIDASQKTITLTPTNKAQSYLSGLADFSASFKQADVQPNPSSPGEKDSFAYRFSQSSSVSDASDGRRSKIVQNTQSHLEASYHASLDPGIPLSMTFMNYKYHQISDDSTSQTALDFDKKGHLASVTSSQTTHNLETVKKYSAGHLQSDTRTPYDHEDVQQTKLIIDSINMAAKSASQRV